MTKNELLSRLIALLGVAADMPDTTNILGYHLTRREDNGLPSILVNEPMDLPPGEQLPLVEAGDGWMEMAVVTKGVKVYCYVAKLEAC